MRPLVRRRVRQATITTLLLVVIAITASLVAVSPLALRGMNSAASDWDRLSAIGQTYGAASALLATLALVGVAISLWLQQREAKTARDQTLRTLHTELLKMAMDDPVYRRSWGDFFGDSDPDAQREHMYTNLIVEHWSMMFAQQAMTEEHLRSLARMVLAGEAGQRYWLKVRELRLTAAGTKAERRFHGILDEEFEQVRSASPEQSSTPASLPLPPYEVPKPTVHPSRYRTRWLLLGMGTTGVLLAIAAWLRRAWSRRQ